MTRKAIKLTLAMTTALAMALPMAAPAGVYDDVTAWWHFDMADSGVVGTATDIRDQRDWESPGGRVATSIQGTPEWATITPDRGPGGGLVYGGRGLDLTPATSPSVVPDGFLVNNFALSGDATLVTRFKWDGYVDPGVTSAWLYRNGYGTNEGWLFGLTGADGSPATYLGFDGGRYLSSSISVDADKWYDMAIVYDDNGTNDTLSFYVWGEGGAFQSQSHSVDFIGTAASSNHTYVGFESTSTGGAKKSFDGLIDHIAVWDRALDVNEIHDAIGSPDPLGSVGIDNATNRDLRYEGAVDADYTPGDPWHEMRRAVTSSRDLATINFDLTAEQAALPFVAHVDMLSAGSGGGIVAMLINGTEVGRTTVTGAGDFERYVDSALLNTGANSLTIQHLSGNYVSWDAMEMGGSWQVGYDDNTPGEFIAESGAPNDFYVTDPNLKHLERAVTDGDPFIRLHFNLSDELANSPEDYFFVYTTEVLSQGGGLLHPIDISVNGTLLASFPGSPDNTVLSVSILSSLLNSGDNVIELLKGNVGSGGWAQFDFHRFEVLQIPEPTTFALAALGFACMVGSLGRRRRRGR